MKIALLQTDIIWNRPEDNLKCVTEVIQKLQSGTEMAVLPEMFSTGFCVDPTSELAEKGKETINSIKSLAAGSGIAICGSVIYKEDKNIFNRFFAALPDGKLFTYDKRHLFRMGDEHKAYSKGTKRITFEYKGLRFLPQICYDLRFPVWSRNRNDYDVAIYIANWPSPRTDIWRKLLIARAIENNCYVVGVNRTGKDGNGYEYSGSSMVTTFNGTISSESKIFTDDIVYSDLSKEKLEEFRHKFPSWMDSDDFEIK